LGLRRVDITGKVLGVLTAVEIVVIIAETVSGLAHPAGGHLSFATLSPPGLSKAGWGSFGVLAVVAVLGFTEFERAPVLALLTEQDRGFLQLGPGDPRRCPDFSRWLQVAVKQPRPHWRTTPTVGSVAAGAGRAYAAPVCAHSETVLRSFYDFHRDMGTGPVINPFPLSRTRRGGRAQAHHNPMESYVTSHAQLICGLSRRSP
jgi:hypothetical protein